MPRYSAPKRIWTIGPGISAVVATIKTETPSTMPNPVQSNWRWGSPRCWRCATSGNIVITTDQVAKKTIRPIKANAAYWPALTLSKKRLTINTSLLLIRMRLVSAIKTGNAKVRIACRCVGESASSGCATGAVAAVAVPRKLRNAQLETHQVATRDKVNPQTAPWALHPSATNSSPISSRTHIST